VSPLSGTIGILASPTLVAGTSNASATTFIASLRPALNTGASEAALGAETIDATITKCGKIAVAPLVGNTNAPTPALGLLGCVLLTAAQAASANLDTEETTTAHARVVATFPDVLILLIKAFLLPLS
jgi:hypothetical protein